MHCVGSEQFRQELLLQMTSVPARSYGGPEWQQSAEKKALQILDEELHRRGWNSEELKLRGKSDPQKLEIAQRLRQQTTMTLA
jgi:hypothetical protein